MSTGVCVHVHTLHTCLGGFLATLVNEAQVMKFDLRRRVGSLNMASIGCLIGRFSYKRTHIHVCRIDDGLLKDFSEKSIL